MSIHRPMREGLRSALSVFHNPPSDTHRHLRERLGFIWLATAGLDLIFSVLAQLLETGRPGSGLHNYGDALFWTTTQLLTISSQLPNPVTAAGKVLDVLMEFVGMTLITAQAGSLGSFLYRRSMEKSPMPADKAATDSLADSSNSTEAGS